MARRSYHRNFRKHGYSFLVQNCYKADMKKPTDVYYLTVMMGGHLRIVHDPFGDIPKFRTIQEAQKYARDWADGEYFVEQVW